MIHYGIHCFCCLHIEETLYGKEDAPMKKSALLLPTAALAFFLCACGGTQAPQPIALNESVSTDLLDFEITGFTYQENIAGDDLLRVEFTLSNTSDAALSANDLNQITFEALYQDEYHIEFQEYGVLYEGQSEIGHYSDGLTVLESDTFYAKALLPDGVKDSTQPLQIQIELPNQLFDPDHPSTDKAQFVFDLRS